MKRIIFTILIWVLTMSTAFAISTEVSGKVGTAYGSNPESFGLDVSLNYNLIFDTYFKAGVELDVFWIQWENHLGTEGSNELMGEEADVLATTDVYVLPLFINAHVLFPAFSSAVDVRSSITGGIGYSIMPMTFNQPKYTDTEGTEYSEESKTELYSSYAWQLFSSILYYPVDSIVSFSIDLGYRGVTPNSNNREINMSGFIAKAGFNIVI